MAADPRFIEDLLDPAKGWVLVRDCFQESEVDAYRDECEAFLRSGPVCHSRINHDKVEDYIHPRSHDDVARTLRIYQYLHNTHSPTTRAFFAKAFALRNEIEETWTHDPTYRAEKLGLHEYTIVTNYIADTGCLPRHRDYAGPAPYPLLQSLILLSSAPDDYRGGDFVLYPRSGPPLALARDLGVKKGDLFLFDKSLDHSVEVTRAGERTNRGRWSVLVGARAPRDSGFRAFMKRLLYSPPRYPHTRPLAKGLRLLRVPV